MQSRDDTIITKAVFLATLVMSIATVTGFFLILRSFH